MSPTVFADLTDAQIWAIYLRKRDADGNLIRRRKEQQPNEESEQLPPLGIPDEAFMLDPDGIIRGDYVQLFWSVERWRRKRTVEQTMEKWRAYVAKEVATRRGVNGEDQTDADGRHWPTDGLARSSRRRGKR